MPQTSYSLNQGVAFAGMLADLSFKRVVTGVNKEGAAIPFGVGVVGTATADEYDLPDAGGDKITGIVVHSHDVDQRALTGVQGVPIDGTMNVLAEGVVWVVTDEAVAVGDPVYCRHTANGGATQLGAFRNDADTANATLVKGATFLTATSGAGIAKIEFSKLVNLS